GFSRRWQWRCSSTHGRHERERSLRQRMKRTCAENRLEMLVTARDREMIMGEWIDEVARAMASGASRRVMLRRVGGGLAGAVLASLVPATVFADKGGNGKGKGGGSGQGNAQGKDQGNNGN